jgi:uncharacterized protein YifN (PemK superfamily)
MQKDNIKKNGNIPFELLNRLIREDSKRVNALLKRYDPLTGKGAPGKRFKCVISDFLNGEEEFLPVQMLDSKFIRALIKCGSIEGYIKRYMPDCDLANSREAVTRRLCRIRCKHDFYFFAGAYAKIQNKNGGEDIPFYLRHAQIKLCKVFEKMRLENLPIYVILLKCRQWGGSTLTDIYMAWIMIFWETSWNCNIVGHQSTSSITVFNMYERLVNSIPIWLFYDVAQPYPEDVVKIKNDSKNPNVKYLVPRSCTIQTGTALNPEAARSTNVAMAHITEEAFFPDTEKWTPSKVVKSVISPIMGKPHNFITRESTPNGSQNEFHDEWIRAKSVDENGAPMSAYTAAFVAWFEIETYRVDMSLEDKKEFVSWLYKNRRAEANNGRYYWKLLKMGATIGGIKWYIEKAKTFDSYPSLDDMQQEFPSDDIEAFKYSGTAVFDIYQVENLREGCDPKIFTGDIEGDSSLPETKECMDNVHLVEKPGGPLTVWDLPDDSEIVRNRYLVSVDIGGSHKTSDWSDMTVFDRYDEMYGGVPVVVAEWHGHCNPDQLAMKCAQLSHFYNDALLAVENNTAYSRMNKTDGDVSELFFPILLPLYDDNVYCDNQSALKMRKTHETKWGVNTNRSTKVAMIMNLSTIIREQGYIEREPEALNEYSYYMLYPNGTYGNVPGKHDDRVMSRAIGLWIDKKMDPPKIIKFKSNTEKEREKLLHQRPKAPEIVGI